MIDLGLDELFALYSSRNAKTCLSFASVLISLYTNLLELFGFFCEDQKYYESSDHSSAYLNSWAGQHADCTIVHCIEFCHVHHAISESLVTSYYY